MIRWLNNRAKGVLSFVKKNPLWGVVVASLCGLVLVGAAIGGAKEIWGTAKLFYQAKEDTNAIAKLRADIQAQHDSIAMVVRDANKARSDIDRIDGYARTAKSKAEEAEVAAKNANASQAELSRLSAFNLILTRANNDDRKAFDELLRIANTPDHPYKEIATSAVVSVVSNSGLFLSISEGDWIKFSFDPKTASLEDYRVLMMRSRPDVQASALDALWAQERFSKFEKLNFSAETISQTQSIRVLMDACQKVNSEAKLDKNILAYPLYLQWWAVHQSDYWTQK